MMQKTKHLILHFCLLLLTSACLKADEPIIADLVPVPDVVRHDILSDNVNIGPKWIELPDVALGFVWPEERELPPDQRTHTREIQLSKSQPFAPYLLLQSPEETVVLITAIVNFEQVSFTLDGRPGILHEVTITSDGDMEIPMQIEIGEPGRHEVMVIAFVDPYNGRFDLDYRSSMNPRSIGRRAAIIVGSNDTPASVLPNSFMGQPVPDNISEFSPRAAFAQYNATEKGHPSDMNKQLYRERSSTSTNFAFNIWMSNLKGDKPVEYASILFQNFRQIDINDNYVLVVDMDVGEEVILDAQIVLPPEPGLNQLQLISVRSPYQPIGEGGTLVYGSPRIAILAEE